MTAAGAELGRKSYLTTANTSCIIYSIWVEPTRFEATRQRNTQCTLLIFHPPPPAVARRVHNPLRASKRLSFGLYRNERNH